MDSPCEHCVHRFTEEIETGLWMDDCEESVSPEAFMSEDGCWRYEERYEPED